MINPIQSTLNILGMWPSRIYNFKEIKMKSLSIFAKITIYFVTFFGVLVITKTTSAQNYRTDGGAIVLEDSLLSPTRKQIVFVVTKNIPQSARVEMQTISTEGRVNKFTPLLFPNGLRQGQIIPMWNNELNSFHTTPWLRFDVTIFTDNDIYYCSEYTPVGFAEQYKEPLITSISETGGYGTDYVITVRGIFDTTEPSIILLNTNIVVSPKVVTQTPPGIIKFTMKSNSTAEFPPGKYLLTLCQSGHCDTLVGRHR